jgi:hypothetical protein
VGLEWGPLSLMSTIEELLGRNSSGSGPEIREYGRRVRHADHVASSIRKKFALTSLTSGGRSVGIVRLRTEATEFLWPISMYLNVIVVSVFHIERSFGYFKYLILYTCKYMNCKMHIGQ